MIKKVWKKIFVEFGENIRVFRALSTLKELRRNLDDSPSESSLIIFTKDRPLQLEALLESIDFYVEQELKPYIIYNASSSYYAKAYQDVFKRYKESLEGVWNDQSGFKKVLLKVLGLVETNRVFFLVDDILFKKKVSLKEFLSMGREYIPSLRLGLHLKRCYTLNIDQELPSFKHEGMKLLTWKYAQGQGDWAYPLSVDGNIFFTEEIKLMTEVLDFKAPNSYEGKLQKFRTAYKEIMGACDSLSSIVNIPCNKVQTENNNQAGGLSAEELLSYFWGKRIDIEKFKNFKNKSCHEELSFDFKKR